jgi:hypothetical protein
MAIYGPVRTIILLFYYFILLFIYFIVLLFYYCLIHKRPPLVPILRETNPVIFITILTLISGRRPHFCSSCLQQNRGYMRVVQPRCDVNCVCDNSLTE